MAVPSNGDSHSGLDISILKTLAYADLFDYPLRADEIHRYLIGFSTSLKAVEDHLSASQWLRARIASQDSFWFLLGRQELIALRQERAAYSSRLWPQARRFGRLIAAMPFVRLVAITGALAMSNVPTPTDDIDYLIVVRTGRVWLARAMTLLVVQLARRRAITLCPNYVLSEARLTQETVDLFTAHEIVQLVPLYGAACFRLFLSSNLWVFDYLPNARFRLHDIRELGSLAQRSQRAGEWILQGKLGDTLERWEQKRKIPALCAQAKRVGAVHACFDPMLCKGHMHAHETRIDRLYLDRLAAIGVEEVGGVGVA